MTKIRVFIADDHAILRAGLRMLIERQPDMTVAGEAGNIGDTLKAMAVARPDVLTLDLGLPDVQGMSGLHRLRECCPDIRIVVLTMHDDAAYLQAAMTGGASGYLVKSAADMELISAIRAVHDGRTYINASMHGQVAPSPAVDPGGGLSEREKTVLVRVAEGFTNQEIADELDLSTKSIESYRSRLMKKLGLKSRADIFRYASLMGLLGDARE